MPLSRALNNLACEVHGRRPATDVTSSQQRNYETMRRYGHVRQTWWARGQLADTAYEIGRWDEALEHAEAVIAYVEAGTPALLRVGMSPRPCRDQLRPRR